VQSGDPARLLVMLDDGRAVAFDVKDYAAIDDGYAATIHKAPGMTVDRVHVLATPVLTRHAGSVLLSRHRDAVNLHYGRDDFADQTRLIRTLSRERTKDMASDFARTPSTPQGRADMAAAQSPIPGCPDSGAKPGRSREGAHAAIERPLAPSSRPPHEIRKAA
jgi:hypothetical protein